MEIRIRKKLSILFISLYFLLLIPYFALAVFIFNKFIFIFDTLNPDDLTLLKIFIPVPLIPIIVLIGYLYSRTRKMEITPETIVIWGRKDKEIEIPKENLLSMEINYGFATKPHIYGYGGIHGRNVGKRIDYIPFKIILKTGEIFKLRIRNEDILDFKNLLKKHIFPQVTERLRGKIVVTTTETF